MTKVKNQGRRKEPERQKIKAIGAEKREIQKNATQYKDMLTRQCAQKEKNAVHELLK